MFLFNTITAVKIEIPPIPFDVVPGDIFGHWKLTYYMPLPPTNPDWMLVCIHLQVKYLLIFQLVRSSTAFSRYDFLDIYHYDRRFSSTAVCDRNIIVNGTILMVINTYEEPITMEYRKREEIY